jgi:hypothetical protein
MHAPDLLKAALAAAVLVVATATGCGGGGETDATSTGRDPTSTSSSTGTGAGGAGGEAGAGGGGGAGGQGGGTSDVGVQATETVSGGEVSKSPNYKMVFTFGQPTQNQGTTTSPSYRVQGGLIGATGSAK